MDDRSAKTFLRRKKERGGWKREARDGGFAKNNSPKGSLTFEYE